MKKIEAIIREEKLEALKQALHSEANITGMTVQQVLGFGKQLGWKEYYRGNEVIINLVPKVEIKLVVTSETVDQVIDIIIETCRTGEVGDGKIFVTTLDECIRIRTGERGIDAV
ncbi:P-II family nitrogen regulator [Carnobacterium gallinarum]|uniref:P-II family nitrogen regulator n=1 Tax=Carnobacterium gallinarum TaxID=2749 RepID=UPI000554A561|nr:P-II family nitrogen regulator [Carnobacterium gallinarum]